MSKYLLCFSSFDWPTAGVGSEHRAKEGRRYAQVKTMIDCLLHFKYDLLSLAQFCLGCNYVFDLLTYTRTTPVKITSCPHWASSHHHGSTLQVKCGFGYIIAWFFQVCRGKKELLFFWKNIQALPRQVSVARRLLLVNISRENVLISGEAAFGFISWP